MIVISCPRCGHGLKVRLAPGAMKVKCSQCGQVMPLPAEAPSASTPATTQDVRHPDNKEGATAATPPAEPHTVAYSPATPCPDGNLASGLEPPRGPLELGWLAHYRVMKILGQGGMGTVYLAEDTRLERPVALKVMKPGPAQDTKARQRFVREAKAIAALKHDHIVTIYQVGDETGVPYLAMEVLQGESLDRWLRRGRRPTPGQVLRLAREIARGLAAAHGHGLVHRDIKPGNLWLEAPSGRVKLLDFGLAHNAKEDLHLTQSGMIIGTPAYMAPEQARGETVDHRTDLFSLGCVLYQLCTGILPFRGTTIMAQLTSLAVDQPKPVKELNPNMPPALGGLVMRLLAKDPADRPASALAVAEAVLAIEQALAQGKGGRGEAEGKRGRALASPFPHSPASLLPSPLVDEDSFWAGLTNDLPERIQLPYRKKSHPRYRRNLVLACAGALLTFLIAVMVVSAWTDKGTVRIETDDPKVAIIIEQNGERVLVIDPESQPTVQLKAGAYQVALGEGAQGLKLETDHFTLPRGGTQTVVVRQLPPALPREKPLAVKALPVVGALDLAGRSSAADALRRQDLAPEWLTAVGNGDPGQALPQLVAVLGDLRPNLGQRVDVVAFSPDGHTLVAGGADGRLTFWDPATGKPRGLPRKQSSWIRSLDFSPGDGSRLAVGCQDGRVGLLATESGRTLHRWQFPGPAVGLAFGPKGNLLAVGDNQHQVHLMNLTTGAKLRTFKAGASPWVEGLSFSPNGKLLAVACGDPTVSLFDPITGQEVRKLVGHQKSVSRVFFSSDGKNLATASLDHTVKWWDAATGQELHTFVGCVDEARLALSPDGKYLASAGQDHTVQLWDLPSRRKQFEIRGHTGRINALTFSPDSATLASGGLDGSVRLWEAATGKERLPPRGHTGKVLGLTVSPDGKLLASKSQDGTVKLWDLATAKVKATWDKTGLGPALAFGPDNRTLAYAGPENSVVVLDITGTRDRRTLTGPWMEVQSVSFSPDGTVLASGDASGAVRLWSLARCEPLRPLHGHAAPVWHVSFSPDGTSLASASADQMVKIWRLADGQLYRTLRGPAGPIRNVMFFPDGTKLAAGGQDGSFRSWDLATGKVLDTWQGSTLGVGSLVCRADGRLLASAGSGEGMVHLWDRQAAPPRRQTLPLFGVGMGVNQVSFTPEGRHLITANDDGTLFVLRLAPPGQVPDLPADFQQVRVFEGHTHPVIEGLALSPDGQQVLSCGRDHTVRRWDVATGKLLQTLTSHEDAVIRVVFRSGASQALSCSLDGTIRLWDLATGKQVRVIEDQKGHTCGLALSADGKLAYSGGEDGSLHVWEVETGKNVGRFPGHTSKIYYLVLSPDGRRILTAGHDRVVRLWDVATGRTLRTFPGEEIGWSCCFAPDGQRGAWGGYWDGTVRIFDLETGRELRRLNLGSASVRSVAFTPDGQRLLAGGSDSQFAMWDVATGQELGR